MVQEAVRWFSSFSWSSGADGEICFEVLVTRDFLWAKVLTGDALLSYDYSKSRGSFRLCSPEVVLHVRAAYIISSLSFDALHCTLSSVSGVISTRCALLLSLCFLALRVVQGISYFYFFVIYPNLRVVHGNRNHTLLHSLHFAYLYLTVRVVHGIVNIQPRRGVRTFFSLFVSFLLFPGVCPLQTCTFT